MRKIRKIEPDARQAKQKKKVAAYARVSTGREAQRASYEAQVDYYTGYIKSREDWEFVRVYTDEGISATGTAGREGFQSMVEDAISGSIELIVTKSISRFARNTVDLLATVRRLKEHGVEVWFEKEDIRSCSGDGELMLSLLASFAQEESRSISENSKWGIRKRFQSGEVGTANKRLLGYRYDEEKKQYVILPEEAEAIRWMFRMYLEGLSLRRIAGNMNRAGIRSVLGNEFREGAVRQMIGNEVYAGDILRQKSFVDDPITKKRERNKGELAQYYMKDCHEAILEREIWEKVQAERGRRAAMAHHSYPFTGKIICGICGRHYTRRTYSVRGKESVRWFCKAKKEPGVTCRSRNYSEEELRGICAGLMGTDEFDEAAFHESVKGMTVLADGSVSMRFHRLCRGIPAWHPTGNAPSGGEVTLAFPRE